MQTVYIKATLQELNGILHIIREAQETLKAQGINQWQNGYPNRDTAAADIQQNCCHVALLNGEVAATASLILGPEPDYAHIQQGAWKTSEHYATLHRLAVACRCRGTGFATQFLQYLEQTAYSAGFAATRVDTHQQNQTMRRFLEKNGYTYCGIIHLPDGNPRAAYDKPLAP